MRELDRRQLEVARLARRQRFAEAAHLARRSYFRLQRLGWQKSQACRVLEPRSRRRPLIPW